MTPNSIAVDAYLRQKATRMDTKCKAKTLSFAYLVDVIWNNVNQGYN